MTDEVLHGLTCILLRLCSPQRAHAIVSRVGALLPALDDRAAVRRAGMRIRNRGTCLSRALAVAARAPDADVVIGLVPPSGQRLLAHVWLELGGEPIDWSDVAGDEIARLRGDRGRRNSGLLIDDVAP